MGAQLGDMILDRLEAAQEEKRRFPGMFVIRGPGGAVIPLPKQLSPADWTRAFEEHLRQHPSGTLARPPVEEELSPTEKVWREIEQGKP